MQLEGSKWSAQAQQLLWQRVLSLLSWGQLFLQAF